VLVSAGDAHPVGVGAESDRVIDEVSGDRLQLRRLYHALFRSGERLKTTLETAQHQFVDAEGLQITFFPLRSSRVAAFAHKGPVLK